MMTQKELSAVAHELGFWKGFVKTERFLKGWVANIPTPELHEETRSLIRAQLFHADGSTFNDKARILDVGSGAVSILRGTVPAEQLIAMDPLSEFYQLVFDYGHYGVKPPIPCCAEEISSAFHGGFNAVHISNALDHCQNPFLAMTSFYDCLKPGGMLLVCGFVNEADHMNGAGMHQWNIDVMNNHSLCIRNIDGKALGDYPGNFSFRKKLTVDGSSRDWIIWVDYKP